MDGPVTIVEFIDYKCGFCKRFHFEMIQLLDEVPQTRYVIKEFPILGLESLLASKASIALLLHQGPDIYRSFTDALLLTNDKITLEKLITIADQAGGDGALIKKYIESEKVLEVLEENYELARALDIQGTPTFVIGSEVVRGYKSKQQLKDILFKNM